MDLLKDWLYRKVQASLTPKDYPVIVLSHTCNTSAELDALLSHLTLWTYREDFQCLPRSSVVSDKGWGCLIRASQMLLTQALKMQVRGGNDQKNNNSKNDGGHTASKSATSSAQAEGSSSTQHGQQVSSASQSVFPAKVAGFASIENIPPQDIQRILSHFMDLDENEEATFSIHNMVRSISNPNEKFHPVFWSPYQGSEAIKVLVNVAGEKMSHPLKVCVADSGGLYTDEIIMALYEGSLLILVPLRSGAQRRISQGCFMMLDYYLRCPYCVGVVGGTPKRSYYLVGITATQKLLYFDPHRITQPVFKSASTLGVANETSQTISSVEWKSIDTSMMVGFIVRNHQEWADLSVLMENAKKSGAEELISVYLSRSQTNASTEAVMTWESDEEDEDSGKKK